MVRLFGSSMKLWLGIVTYSLVRLSICLITRDRVVVVAFLFGGGVGVFFCSRVGLGIWFLLVL